MFQMEQQGCEACQSTFVWRHEWHQGKQCLFWQFWVSGAPCNLSHNINCDLALVNGTPAIAHSLTFSDEHEHSQIMSIINGPPPSFWS